jgi:hypothetical protein
MHMDEPKDANESKESTATVVAPPIVAITSYETAIDAIKQGKVDSKDDKTTQLLNQLQSFFETRIPNAPKRDLSDSTTREDHVATRARERRSSFMPARKKEAPSASGTSWDKPLLGGRSE